MHKSFLSLFSFIIFLTNLSACGSEELQWQKIDKQVSIDAEELGGDAHRIYLRCYPLDQQSKQRCIEILNGQYVKDEYKTDPYYQRSFQYKAEKLGFLKFLRDRNLLCSGIDHGPKFVNADNAYQVSCTCGNNYLMQFDYDNKKWHLMR